METPYITRSTQPPVGNGGTRPEIFKPEGEQARRSILSEIIQDIESPNPKDNVRVLGVVQNMNILTIQEGKSQGLDKISAPLPGMEHERNLQGMIEDGLVNPSQSMREMADRHGLELPEKRKDGPNPSRTENSPELLKMPNPEGDLTNPGLRKLAGALADKSTEATREKAEATRALDNAFATILNPQERKLTKLEKDKEEEPTPVLPWLKKESKKKEEDKPKDPITAFNDAGNKLLKLPPAERLKLLGNYVEDKLGNASKSVSSFGKTFQSLTTKSTPHGKALKASLEFFQEATSNKPVGEKLMGMGKAAGKAVLSLAQMAGTKVAATSLATPAAPITIALMVVAATVKFALDPFLGEIADQTKGDKTKAATEEKPPQDGQKGDAFDRGVDTLFPGTGGKKGLAAKGAMAGTKKATEWLQEDVTSNKAEERVKKQGEKEKDPEPAL